MCENIQTQVKDFFLPQPHVSISLRHLPLSLSSSLSKPLLRSTVSIATLTSRWGRHPHSCCANTAMSHWHTLTHFSVEIALTHKHSHWTECKMDQRTCGSGAGTGLYLCSSEGLRVEHGRKILGVVTTQRLLVWLVEMSPPCLGLCVCSETYKISCKQILVFNHFYRLWEENVKVHRERNHRSLHGHTQFPQWLAHKE